MRHINPAVNIILPLACLSLLSGCNKEQHPEQQKHYDNPFAESTKGYVNPLWAEKARADGGEAIANESTAIWLNHTWDVKAFAGKQPKDGMGLREHLDAALAQQADLISLVLYNLPGKGCSYFGNIMTDYHVKPSVSAESMVSYKKDFIDEIVRIASDNKYANISIVAIIEPDSLINIAEHPENCEESTNDKPWGFTEGVRYALTQFHSVANIHSYLDVGHAAMVGWEQEMNVAAMLYYGVINGFDGLDGQSLGDDIESMDGATDKYKELGKYIVESAGETPAPGWKAINGFASNIANYIPLEEPYLKSTPVLALDDPFSALQTASFFDWNPTFGELDYSEEWLDAMSGYGADDSIAMIIDTSRNGWGSPNRPVRNPDTVYKDAENEVEDLRIDQRPHRRSYCNQKGAGLGERPQANPQRNIDAYIWAKPVGESDGISSGDFLLDPEFPNHKFEETCDPQGINRFAEESNLFQGQGVATGAMADAPHYGKWFSAAFKQLLLNAYPPIK